MVQSLHLVAVDMLVVMQEVVQIITNLHGVLHFPVDVSSFLVEA